jgi:hypothetical protein
MAEAVRKVTTGRNTNNKRLGAFDFVSTSKDRRKNNFTNGLRAEGWPFDMQKYSLFNDTDSD